MQRITKSLFIIIFSLLLAITLFAGCEMTTKVDSDKSDISNPPDDDDTSDEFLILSIKEGNFQAGTIEESFAKPLTVIASNEDGSPVSGLSVSFFTPLGLDEGKGEVFVSQAFSVTNVYGEISSTILAGSKTGMARVVAKASPGIKARPVTFNLSIFPKPAPNKIPISFLSINDFHSHLEPWGHPDDLRGGLARIVTLFKETRANNKEAGIQTVIMNGGDDFENTLYNDVPGFLEWLVATWDNAGMDIWQVGNHDFHFGIPFLTEKLLASREKFEVGEKTRPMVITFGNVDPSTMREDLLDYADYFETGFNDHEESLLYQQASILNMGSIKLGILGVVTDAGIYIQVPGDPLLMRLVGAQNPFSEGATFFDPDPRKSDYISRGIDYLDSKGAHVIVVVSHAGLGLGDRVNIPFGKDEFIARYAIGATSGRAVDLIVSAHSHVQLNHPVFLKNPAGGLTPIVQAREGGLFAARVDGVVDTENGSFEFIDSRLIQINADIPCDPKINDDIDFWREKAIDFYGNWFDWDLIEFDSWLSHRAETISGLGLLINDSFHWALEQDGLPVDSSMAVPSLYRADIWPGLLTAAQAYDVLSLHKMSDQGHAPDTLAILTFRPGIINASMLGLPGTWKTDTTPLEFALEVIYALPEIVDVIPLFGTQLNIEAVQLSGLQYEVDLTAPMFHKIIPGSVTFNGEPVDSKRAYTLAMVHSLAGTLAYALNTLVFATADGEGVVNILLDDPDSGCPFYDSEIPIWQAFQEYLDHLPGSVMEEDKISVIGQNVITTQPDLAINSTDISVQNAVIGKSANILVRVRNNGRQGVENALVKVYVDYTPWDQTDQDDGRYDLEGFGDYTGSLTEVARRNVTVGPYPDVKTLDFKWEAPVDLPPGLYTAHVRIIDIIGNENDPNTGKPYTDWQTDNNGGEQVMTYFYLE